MCYVGVGFRNQIYSSLVTGYISRHGFVFGLIECWKWKQLTSSVWHQLYQLRSSSIDTSSIIYHLFQLATFAPENSTLLLSVVTYITMLMSHKFEGKTRNAFDSISNLDVSSSDPLDITKKDLISVLRISFCRVVLYRHLFGSPV